MTNSVALCRLAASTRPIAALALISCLSISRAATTDPACGNSRGTGPATPCVIHSAPSEYNERVLVVDSGIYRAMRFDSIDSRDQSRIRPGHPEELPMPYLRSAAVGLVVPPTLEHLLVIGLGGGAFPRFVASRFPDVAVDAVEIDPVVATVARDYFGVAGGGALVSEVYEDSPAEKAGVKAGDIIVEVAKDRVYEVDDVTDALEDFREGDEVTVEVLRNGTRQAIKVTVGETKGSYYFLRNGNMSDVHIDMPDIPDVPEIRVPRLPRAFFSDEDRRELREELREAQREIREATVEAQREAQEELKEALEELQQEMKELRRKLD